MSVPRLSDDLWIQYTATGTTGVRDQLAEQYLPLVKHITHRAPCSPSCSSMRLPLWTLQTHRALAGPHRKEQYVKSS